MDFLKGPKNVIASANNKTSNYFANQDNQQAQLRSQKANQQQESNRLQQEKADIAGSNASIYGRQEPVFDSKQAEGIAELQKYHPTPYDQMNPSQRRFFEGDAKQLGLSDWAAQRFAPVQAPTQMGIQAPVPQPVQAPVPQPVQAPVQAPLAMGGNAPAPAYSAPISMGVR